MRGWPKLLSAALGAWLLVGLSAACAEEFPVARGPSAEPNPYDFEWSAARAAAPGYAGHDAWYPLWKETHELLPDGTVLATSHYVAIANDRHALDVVGDWILWFDPSCEQVTLNEARLHKPDGSVKEIDAADVRIRDDNTDDFVFVPDKVMVVSTAGLEVGDAIEIKYTRRIDDPQTHGELCGRHIFTAPDFPIHASELAVRLPIDRKLSQFTYDLAEARLGLAPLETVEESTRTWTWKAAAVAPAESVAGAPFDFVAEPGVDFTTYPSWDAVADLVRGLRNDRSEITSELAGELVRVTAGAQTPLEKTRALTIWVRDSFRYLSIDHGAYGFRPHPPELVLAKRFGDCKDLCHLLYLMLREAGVDAEMVFLNVEGEPPIRHEIPSPLASHVVLLVRLEGEEHWIDPTSSTTAWNRLRTDLFGQPAVAVGERQWRTLTTPLRAAELNHLEIERTASLAIGGAVSWRAKQTWRDYAADDERGELVGIPANQRRRKLFADFSIYHPQARLREANSPLALGQADEPLVTEIAFEEPPPAVDVDSILRPLLETPPGEEIESDGRNAIGFVSPALLRHTAAGFEIDRAAAWRIDGLRIDDRLAVRIPPGIVPLIVTAGEKVESRYGSAALETALNEDRSEIVFQWRLECAPKSVPREHFEEYLDFLDAIDDLAMVDLEYAAAGDLSANEGDEVAQSLAEANDDPRRCAAIVDSMALAGNEALARSLLDKGLEQSPDDPALLAWRGRLAAKSADRVAALSRLSAVKDRSPLAELCLARELFTQKKYAEALTQAKGSLAIASGDDRALATLLAARCEWALRRPAAALALIEGARRGEDEAADPELDLLAAEIHFEGKNWKAALAACELAQRGGLGDDRPLRLAAEAALAAKDRAAAARNLRAFLTLADDDPTLWLSAAQLCVKADRADEAKDFAQRALDSDDPREAKEAATILAKLKGVKKPPAGK